MWFKSSNTSVAFNRTTHVILHPCITWKCVLQLFGFWQDGVNVQYVTDERRAARAQNGFCDMRDTKLIISSNFLCNSHFFFIAQHLCHTSRVRSRSRSREKVRERRRTSRSRSREKKKRRRSRSPKRNRRWISLSDSLKIAEHFWKKYSK